MIRMTTLALVALSTPALAQCPEYIKPEYCNSYAISPPASNLDAINDLFDEPTPRRSYQPTYQEPIEEPRRPISSYELDNAIRQIPGWNKQFPNYGR